MEEAIVLYKGKPKTNSWARWLVRRTMKKNQNNLCSVVGKTGSGKTYSAISICEIMTKLDGVPFTIDHIVFSLQELMDLITSDRVQKGSKIIFDEPQVSISSRDFQSQANKVFNYLISTFRHRNLSLFFCTPFEDLLDKNTRKMFHVKFDTISINRKNNTCRLKPRFVEYVDFKPIPMRKRMIVMQRNNGRGTSSRLDWWDVPKPSKEIIIQYEKKKREFTDRLNKNILVKLKQFDEAGNSLTSEHEQEQHEKPFIRIIGEHKRMIYDLWYSGAKFKDRIELEKHLHDQGIKSNKGRISSDITQLNRKGCRIEY